MNNNQPLVSICIPTYNSIRYIRETLDSLRTQTYSECEIIVSDNASDDGTAVLLTDYAKLYGIRVLLNETNLGAGENFNRLIAAANGEYVAIYHADDLYAEDIVAESVAVLQRNASVGLVGTMAEVFDANGLRLYDYCMPKGYQVSNEGIFDFDAAMMGVLRTRQQQIFFVTPSIMVRREVYRTVGSFDQNKWCSSVDYEMWLRIALHYPVAILNRPLMYYRIHASQGSELEVRKNVELPDVLAVIQAYRPYVRNSSVDRFCTTVIDRIRLKTALKLNAVGQYAKSNTTIASLGTWRYRICACAIRVANILRFNMDIWP